MKMKKLLFSILLFLSITSTVDGQEMYSYSIDNPSDELLKKSDSGLLSKQQAIFDIASLVFSIGEIHPDMFSVCKQEDFFKTLNDIEEKLPDSLTTLKLYQLIQPLVVKIGDGHTSLFYPLNDAFKKDTPRIPLSFRVMPNNDITVLFSIDDKIPEGARIIKINGVSDSQMFEKMLDYVSGESMAYKMQKVRNGFAAFFFMLYSADSYNIEYLKPGEKELCHITLTTCPNHELFALKKKKQKESTTDEEKEIYSFRIMPKGNVAIMDFRSFSDVERMKVFADSMFTTLRNNNITNLIIDITENGGGNSQVGDVLLRYISPKPFSQFGKYLVRVTPTSQALMKEKINIGWYSGEVRDDEMKVPLTDKEGHFKGNVYLLTSSNTFSSASSFAWTFKEFGMGTVVGEETGGMNVCFGDILEYKLPISGLNAFVSYKRFWQYGADEKDIHGTIPDYKVAKHEALSKAISLCTKH